MPDDMAAEIPPSDENEYEPPDVFIPELHPPPNEIDVTAIAELGTDFLPLLAPSAEEFYESDNVRSRNVVSILEPGKGVSLGTYGADYLCDGSYDSFCHRNRENHCLLYAHNDNRGHMKFDSYSGWLVMNVPRVRHGVIVVKFHSWHPAESDKRTEGWTSINNKNELDEDDSKNHPPMEENKSSAEMDQSKSEGEGRELRKKKGAPSWCNEFKFDYAVDGNITSLSLDEYNKAYRQIQRVVEVITVLDDPTYTGGKEKDVQVAIRIRGCGRSKVYGLTHIYWA